MASGCWMVAPRNRDTCVHDEIASEMMGMVYGHELAIPMMICMWFRLPRS